MERVKAERKAAQERRAREKEARNKFLSFLAIAFPKAIFVDRDKRIPLKVGIAQEILERLRPMEAQYKYFDKERYKILHNYCHSLPYLERLAEGVDRVDLDGNFAGHVEEEHKANALEEIERIKKEIAAHVAKMKAKAKKKMAPKKPQQRRPGGPSRPRPGVPTTSGGYQNRYQQGGSGNSYPSSPSGY